MIMKVEVENIKKHQRIVSKLNSRSDMEIYTPLGLVREMLDSLPGELWTNPSLTWCDPCCKSGMFLSEIIVRLHESLRNWEPDDNKRYDHIINNMIHGFCYTKIGHQITKKLTNINNIGFIDLENLKLKKKYDVIVSNIPFNDSKDSRQNNAKQNIYHKIVEYLLNRSTHLMVTMPNRWMLQERMNDFRKKVCTSGIKFINTVDGVKHFGNEIRGGISYTYIDQNYKDSILAYNNKQYNSKQILTKYDKLVLLKDDVVYNILDKMCKHMSLSKMLYNTSTFDIKTNDKRLSFDVGNIKCKVSSKNEKDPTKVNYSESIGYYKYIDSSLIRCSELLPTYKVVLPNVCGSQFDCYKPKDVILLKPNEICNGSFGFFSFDTEEEANNMVSYLNSKLITYIFSLFKFKQHINAQNFDFIPYIPMNIKWNDQEIFSYFNLNKEEIDYIINL